VIREIIEFCLFHYTQNLFILDVEKVKIEDFIQLGRKMAEIKEIDENQFRINPIYRVCQTYYVHRQCNIDSVLCI